MKQEIKKRACNDEHLSELPLWISDIEHRTISVGDAYKSSSLKLGFELVLEGCMDIIIKGQHIKVTAGEIMVLPTTTEIEIRCVESYCKKFFFPFRWYSCCFDVKCF